MLRRSYATALRTKFERSMALRVPLSSSWARAPQRLSVAPRLQVLESFLTRKIPAGARAYSNNPGDQEIGSEGEELSTTVPVHTEPVLAPATPRQSKYKRENEDPILRAAIGGTPRGDGEGSRVSHKVVELELKWLKDPRALADRVGRLLGAGDVALAAEIVRTAQKEQMECSVAWNHLLEYCMNRRNPRAAFKFYNDMKKRGRKPNSRTYTIMLNGLTKAGKFSGLNPVNTARSIYRSLFAANSPVKPQIIHSNAMLNVCAHHGDMDTLWEIAGELPEDGPESPDSVTYTTILKAIRESTQRDLAALEPHEAEKSFSRKALCVTEGKRIWSDIVYRWKRGQLSLDNTLVSAMAGVLLEGTGDRHFYEVFALYRQTTGIPILMREPSPDVSRRSVRPTSRRNSLHEREGIEDVPFVDEGGRLYQPSEGESETIEKEEEDEEGEVENFEKLFNPVVPADTPPTTKLEVLSDQAPAPSYIALGNRELSMILETCLVMNQAFSVGGAYWRHLTQEDHGYRITPDAGSFHQYLRLLRRGRSSRATVEVVRDQMLPVGKADGRTFHIALSCCRRDRKNINVLKNANELLKTMDSALVIPDPRALEGYFDLIQLLEDNPQHLMSLNGLEVDRKRSPNNLGALGRELQLGLLTAAVENLRPLVSKLNEAMEHGHVSRALPKGPLKKRSDRDKVPGAVALKALTRMRMLIDSICKADNNQLSKKARQQFEEESKDLRKYSKPEVIEKYKTSLVSPTPDQILQFRQRRGSRVEVEDSEN